MIEQVLISKRLFTLGESYTKQTDPLSAGIAISLFQDSVEQLLWCIAKKNDVSVKDTESFTSILEKIEKVSIDNIPNKAKILELNKARVGFKHYGNLPANSESDKFRSYTYDFLLVASERYLGLEFDKVSLASLVPDSTIRNHIEKAQRLLVDGQIKEAVCEISLARYYLFKKISQHLPKVDHRLSDADRLFQLVPELRGSGLQIFRYLTRYLDEVAHFTAATLAGGNIGEHLHFERTLPRISKYASGRIEYSHTTDPSNELAEDAIKYVVETAIRLGENLR